MNSEIVIRQYRTTDWERVASLLAEGYDSPINKETLESKYIGEDRNVLVAECNGTVAGTIFWEEKRDYVRPSTTLYLTYLIVNSEYRRHGIAKQLCWKAEEICRKRGCNSIELTSANFRTNAHALYKSIGYTIKNTSIFIKEM